MLISSGTLRNRGDRSRTSHSITDACERTGARLLVDAYHHLNVVPFDLRAMHLKPHSSPVAVTRTASLARVMRSCVCRRTNISARVLTGWFAEFGQKQRAHHGGVSYPEGAAAFMGATYAPHLALPRRRRF